MYSIKLNFSQAVASVLSVTWQHRVYNPRGFLRRLIENVSLNRASLTFLIYETLQMQDANSIKYLSNCMYCEYSSMSSKDEWIFLQLNRIRRSNNLFWLFWFYGFIRNNLDFLMLLIPTLSSLQSPTQIVGCWNTVAPLLRASLENLLNRWSWNLSATILNGFHIRRENIEIFYYFCSFVLSSLAYDVTVVASILSYTHFAR